MRLDFTISLECKIWCSIRYLLWVADLKETSKLPHPHMIIQANKNMFKVNNEGRGSGVAYLKETSKLGHMIFQENKNIIKVNNEGRVRNLYAVNKSDTQWLKYHVCKYVMLYKTVMVYQLKFLKMVNALEDKTCQIRQAKGVRVDLKYFCNQS